MVEGFGGAWGECEWTARDLYAQHHDGRATVTLGTSYRFFTGIQKESLDDFDRAVRFVRSEWDSLAADLPNPANPELRGASPGLYITLALMVLFLLGALLLVGK